MRPAGLIIDVPITLSVSVRGAREEIAMKVARDFADSLIPRREDFLRYIADATLPVGVSITDVGMESNPEDGCTVLDELAADDARDEH